MQILCVEIIIQWRQSPKPLPAGSKCRSRHVHNNLWSAHSSCSSRTSFATIVFLWNLCDRFLKYCNKHGIVFPYPPKRSPKMYTVEVWDWMPLLGACSNKIEHTQQHPERLWVAFVKWTWRCQVFSLALASSVDIRPKHPWDLCNALRNDPAPMGRFLAIQFVSEI